MLSTSRGWRTRLRLIVCLTCASVSWPGISRSADAPKSPTADGPKVDVATNKLAAANGLYQRGLFKLAAEEYKEFLDQNPAHEQASAARYALAVCDYSQGDFAAAIPPLQTVLADPKFDQRDEAMFVLGYCQLAGKQYDAASATLSSLLGKFPDSKRAESAAIYRIQSFYLNGKFKEVGTAFNDFAGHFAKSLEMPTALYFQSLSQRSLGQNDLAAATLERLAKDFPDSKYKFDGILLLGQTLESQGKFDLAIEQYRKLLADTAPGHKADAHYSLGVVLYKTGAYADSATELTQLTENFPTSQYAKPAKLQLGLSLLAGGKTSEARKTLTAVVKDDAERTNDARYGLSQCDIADKKFDAALSTLDGLIHVQPPMDALPQILLDHALCMMDVEKFEPAVSEYAAFESKYPDSPLTAEALYRHAFCLHRLAKYELSLALCERIAKLPNSAMTAPAADLFAENLFLLAKYADAQKQFAVLAQDDKDEQKRLHDVLRQGQCEYFAGNYAKAVALLKPLFPASGVKASDESLQAQFLAGDALLQQGGQDSEAATLLKAYIAAAKGDQWEARYKLVLALAQSHDPAGALKEAEPLNQGPVADQWVQRGLLEAGQLNYNSKNSDAAAGSLTKLLATKPAPELADSATYLLGAIDFDAKRYMEAAAKWDTVAKKSADPKLATDAAFQRVVALKKAGKTDEALAAAQAFADAHPEKGQMARANQLAGATLYDLALEQREKKENAAAIETYGKILKLAPEGKLASAARYGMAELLYDDKKYADAAGLLEAVAADKSADEDVLMNAMYKLGWCREKLGDTQKALTVFTSFASSYPADPKLTPSALLEAGTTAATVKKFDEAEKSLLELFKRFPDYYQLDIAFLKLGEAQAEQQEFDASLESYRRFLEKYSKSEFAYRAEFGVAWALENQKKYDEARKNYLKVIAASNGEFGARSQFQIGETLLFEQKFESAIKELLTVDIVYSYPKWSARALCEAGRAFEQLKQPDQAKRQYDQVIAKYKDAPEAALARERLSAL